jgi:hypothetical protein
MSFLDWNQYEEYRLYFKDLLEQCCTIDEVKERLNQEIEASSDIN